MTDRLTYKWDEASLRKGQRVTLMDHISFVRNHSSITIEVNLEAVFTSSHLTDTFKQNTQYINYLIYSRISRSHA